MTDVTQDGTPQPSGARPGRRQFVIGACAAAAALAFTMAGRGGLPFGIDRVFAAQPGDGGYDAFIVLSQHLTGRTSYDQLLAQRVYAALASASSQFGQNVVALNTWIGSHGGVPSDTVTAALQGERPELAATVGDIMRAWYLGLVGELPHVQVVAYEKALMFDPVGDVLTIPSYCRDVPFYWTRKPDGG
ncbi:MAG: sorbitol dehydrogenase [Paraburkholderia sp.]|uniref:sugar dehydrogenase complex small subunit n=1 Tax=Paraburkholderia sp. TaxID=1926495 RepID=UPI0012194466|nr:sugar dehydrogenase complex small subunit [Paraburkholderia sp.]TAL99659.1 MAG: sorbitol dehydrogenase [Paraburkholderia sp.]TAM29126.1 MAG: sorbitol dehydrogenase [Paraburkholderia sp.]